MQTLSFTQEFYLCAVNSKGTVPFLRDVEVPACIIAGCLMEMINHGYIVLGDKKKLNTGKAWDDEIPYVKPLYDVIVSSKKAKKLKDVALEFWVSDKKREQLTTAFGVSLLASESVDVLDNQGLLKKKTRYAPKADHVLRVIEKVRAEFLEDGVVTEETTCLAALLEKSGLIRDYFSKIERKKLKERLKEVRDSEMYASLKEIVEYIQTVIVILTTVH